MLQNSKVENTKNPTNRSIRIQDKLIDLSTPRVMGIVNATPDSFYEKSRVETETETLNTIAKMVEDGMSIVDVGGYSSRPGALDITIEEEMNRVIPLIKAIRKEFPELIISLDTFRSLVAENGIENGANIINDISGFSIDPKIVNVIAKQDVPYILMHMQGTPLTMQTLTSYDNIFSEMVSYFSKKINHLIENGVKDIIIDPGFGFSKTIEQSHDLLNHLESFHILNKPILVGLSRKSMIYKKLNITPEESLNGTIALNAVALSKGASILRVHDVKEAKQLTQLLA